PKVVQSDFTGITGVIASYSTKYRTWQRDRTHNLMTAARALNGTLIKPGEVFSYNEVVGPRQPSRGYRKAPIFVRGEVEQGIGGGVCQVSTTLYNAALLANMEIVSRAHHSRPVDYAPVGRDATVAYPSPDLKFKNTTPAPVYISASVGGGTVNITLFGRKMDDQEVELVSEGHQVIRPRVIRIADKNLSPGEEIVREAGRPGHRVKIYRIIKKHGQVIKKELICSDFYKPEDRVVAFGELQDSAKSATVSIDKAKSSVYNN
ncbi:MAG: VanW family protein, partial [Armatimonadetes bacterium]|nr:VanW family protein [Armatimonadota bacterium]